MIKLIADSCCDLVENSAEHADVKLIPLSITIADKLFVDNGSIIIPEFLKEMKAYPKAPATSCPSPADFCDAMSGDDDVFAVTMSRHVSGTYQSAVAGSLIKDGAGRVHVFDSKSASAGQTLVINKLLDYIRSGMTYEKIIEKTESFIDGMSTFFVLQSLDNLIKNGRMSRLVGQVASILNMRPIMGADDGKIVLIEKARGTANAMSKLVETVAKRTAASIKDCIADQRDTLIIAHCNCAERALQLKADMLEKCNSFKNIVIVKTGGLSTTYANEGGIIIAY